MSKKQKEVLVEKEVTYTLFIDDKFYIIENVPARVNLETGEQFFSPATVENIQDIILSKDKPVRMVETAVFDFA